MINETVTKSFSVDVLKLDNSHCWTHSKEVFYSVKVILPEEERVSLPKKHNAECLGTSCTNEATSGRRLSVPEVQQEDSMSLYFTPSPGSGSLSLADSREERD